MGQRGKQSGASLSVISSDVSAIKRLDPPEYLNNEQAEVWVTVVNRMPADWLREETEGELANYCVHTVEARFCAKMIEQHKDSEDFDLATHNQLQLMHERQTRAASSLGTRLRITPQSTIQNKRRSKDPKPKRPWDN